MSEKKLNHQQQKSGDALIPGNLPEIRRIWHDNEWYYAVVDFIKIWTESSTSYDYWRMMKLRADPELKKLIETHLVSHESCR